MRMNKILLMIVAAALSAFSQTLPQGVEKKATVGGITEYDYPNGLRVLLFPDPSSPKVTVNMTYLVGSRFEGYGETGMAHLLEHMNFILSTNGRSIKKELTDHGAQWNGTHRLRPHQLLRNRHRERRQSQMGAGSRSRAHGQHADRKAAARYRNDRGAQRVREGRKQPAGDSGGARDRDGVPLAQLREIGDRLARRYRKSADRPAGGVLQEVLSAG